MYCTVVYHDGDSPTLDTFPLDSTRTTSIQFVRLFPPPLLLDPPQTRGGLFPGGLRFGRKSLICPKISRAFGARSPLTRGGDNPGGGNNLTNCIDNREIIIHFSIAIIHSLVIGRFLYVLKHLKAATLYFPDT